MKKRTYPPPWDGEQIANGLDAAFGHVVLGNGSSLHQADAIDCYKSPSHVEAVRSLDTYVRWQEIDDEAIEYFQSSLGFMDAEGFRFHFPRYMTFTLDNAYKGGISGAVMAAPWACSLTDEHGLSKFSLFDRKQLAITAQCLNFIFWQRYDSIFDLANKALSEYWSQFL